MYSLTEEKVHGILLEPVSKSVVVVPPYRGQDLFMLVQRCARLLSHPNEACQRRQGDHSASNERVDLLLSLSFNPPVVRPRLH